MHAAIVHLFSFMFSPPQNGAQSALKVRLLDWLA